MTNLSNIGLTAMSGGIYSYGMILIADDFYKGLLCVGIGVIVMVAAAFLNKKGIPVGKSKK